MAVLDENADALLESRRIQSAASTEGFDWPDIQGVLDKVEEETREIRAALASGDDVHARRELGDLLLITVNLARFLDADPREELLAATLRFANRFHYLKGNLARAGKCVQDCSLEELESQWQQVKVEADKLLGGGA